LKCKVLHLFKNDRHSKWKIKCLRC
jgi:hypothetical protein